MCNCPHRLLQATWPPGDQSLPSFPRLGGLHRRKPEASSTFQSPLGSAQRLQRLQRLLGPEAAPAASVLVPTLRPLWNLGRFLFHVHMISAQTRTLGVEEGEGLRAPRSLMSDGHGGGELVLGIAHTIGRR